jgi:hypothetical protein
MAASAANIQAIFNLEQTTFQLFGSPKGMSHGA